MLVRLKNRPQVVNLVISWFAFNEGPLDIVLNLIRVNGAPFLPSLSWKNMIGLPCHKKLINAQINKMGDNIINPSVLAKKSNIHFNNSLAFMDDIVQFRPKHFPNQFVLK